MQKNSIYKITTLIFILLLSLIPLFRNYKYNNNHENDLLKDYTLHLLSSAEKDSILMTEGGDNQVFSSLYYTQVEYLRPDLTIYDQNGNVFKKIYGDLRYLTKPQIDHRKSLVDKHLLLNEEPFYKDVRQENDPYFVPYMKKKDIYMTWKWDDLVSKGLFYYKPHGILYKVQDLAYGIVDYLEVVEKAKLGEIKKYLEYLYTKPVSLEDMSHFLQKLEHEGYIKKDQANYMYVKPYKKNSLAINISNILEKWDNSHTKYYEFMSQQLLVEYMVTLGTFILEDVKNLNFIYEHTLNEDIKPSLKSQIDEKIKLVDKSFDIAIAHQSFAPSQITMIAYSYLCFPVGDRTGKALNILRSLMDEFNNTWSAYQLYFTTMIKKSLLSNSFEIENQKEINHYYNKLLKSFKRYKVSRKDPFKHPKASLFAPVRIYLEEVNEFPNYRLKELLNSQYENYTHENLFQILQVVHQRVYLFTQDERIKKLYLLPSLKLLDYLIDDIHTDTELSLLVDFTKAIAIYQPYDEFLPLYEKSLLKAYNSLGFLSTHQAKIDWLYYAGLFFHEQKEDEKAKAFLTAFIDQATAKSKLMKQYKQEINITKKVLKTIKGEKNE